MAAIVYQTNKKTGVTYAYESISYWDKDKQQSRAKRKCIGRVDPETQKIIPTRKRKPPAVGKKPNGDRCRLHGLPAVSMVPPTFLTASERIPE